MLLGEAGGKAYDERLAKWECFIGVTLNYSMQRVAEEGRVRSLEYALLEIRLPRINSITFAVCGGPHS